MILNIAKECRRACTETYLLPLYREHLVYLEQSLPNPQCEVNVSCICNARTIILVSKLCRGPSSAHVEQVKVESVSCLPNDVVVPVRDNPLHDAVE